MAKDYYLILGVSADAEPSEIRSAYRGLVKEHHPDSGGHEARFREIREAYEVLSDPDRRSGYDRSRYQDSSSVMWSSRRRPTSRTYRTSRRSAGGPASWYFNEYGPSAFGERGEVQRYFLVLSPSEARSLDSVPVPISISEACDVCRGIGAIRGHPCRNCRASGGRRESFVVQVPLPAALRNGSFLDFLIRPSEGAEVRLQLHIRIE